MKKSEQSSKEVMCPICMEIPVDVSLCLCRPLFSPAPTVSATNASSAGPGYQFTKEAQTKLPHLSALYPQNIP